MNTKFVIHSASERGFWHEKLGWVYRAASATKYNIKQRRETVSLPISSENDTEWLPYAYDE